MDFSADGLDEAISDEATFGKYAGDDHFLGVGRLFFNGMIKK